tara:strand:+ start:7000 stop:7434 length:435 start_codon:yes stop_codon:yes gene_type:complete
MDLRKIKKLIEMLQESDLNEIEVKEGEESVRINRKKEKHIVQSVAKQSSKATKSDDTVDADDFTNLDVITSPMVGTFYKKPAPDKDPFVQVGQEVKKGDTVCIIEAMKMMNQVKSEFDGTIISVDVEDGEPVEFNQTLISIERN